MLTAHQPGELPRDWKEDFSHENGQYQCLCFQCSRLFYGHKRRVTCKDCAGACSDIRSSDGV